jgi:hypothetical protein
VELYTSLTGQDAPDALRNAYQTLLALQDESVPYDPEAETDMEGNTLVFRGDGSSANQYYGTMSGEYFLSRYSFKKVNNVSKDAYINTRGSSWKSRRCNTMESYCHVNSGSVSHRMAYKNVWNSWKTYKTKTVKAGYTSYLNYVTSWKKFKKASVFNADNAVYHASYCAGGYILLGSNGWF